MRTRPRVQAQQPSHGPHEAQRHSVRGLVADRPLLRAVRTFVPFARPYWRSFLVAAFAVMASSLVGLLHPWPVKFLIDNVLSAASTGVPPWHASLLVAAIAGSLVAIAVVQGLFQYLKAFVLSATAHHVAFGLRTALFRHLQRLPLAFHDRQRTGDLITRITSDVSKVQDRLTDDLLVTGVTNVLQLTGMLAVMFFSSWRLGVIAAASVPLIAGTVRHFRQRIREQEEQVRAKEGDIASLAQETISSIRLVKAFGREGFEAQRFEEHAREMREAGIRSTRLEARFSWTLQIITATSLAALVIIGAHEVLAGTLSVGTLVVFIHYMRDLQHPLISLSRLSAKTARALARAERLMEVLDERPAVKQRPGARLAPRFRGEICFDHVSFGYDPGRFALRNINLTIRPGEVVAIVGPTGAGKSTLASLIHRLYDPWTGRVSIDGHDLREYRLDSVIDQIAVVLQESLLFQTTIRENIAYGRPTATFTDIREAARLAHCDEFTCALPDGLDMIVGERGTTLSGGQRQRVAIARAVIRDAPIIILDEPTNGLDAESEATVMLALEQLMRNRTTVMIAHKLATARRADRIFVLDQGELVEEGSHEELIAKGGAYARAFRLQTA